MFVFFQAVFFIGMRLGCYNRYANLRVQDAQVAKSSIETSNFFRDCTVGMKKLAAIKTKEDVVYTAIFILLTLSIVGLPFVHYAVYLLPVVAILVWVSSSDLRLHLDRHIAPFAFLMALIMLTVYNIDYNWAKKAYFVAVYLSIFLLFDMSKIRINVQFFNLVFILCFLITELPHALMGSGGGLLAISLLDSKATLESTFGFPLGLFAVYFLSQRRYFWFALNLIFAVLAFKRVVLLAIAVVVVAFFMPKKIRAMFINPYAVTIAVMLIIVVLIELATGKYDSLIHTELGISANQLLMGRQDLWSFVLNTIHFDYREFLLYGVGHGKVTSLLQAAHAGRDILLHSDLLLILFEHGIIALVVFSFLLAWQKTPAERYLALYLCVLFISDNVLIYQHLMIPYLLLLAQQRSGMDMAANPVTRDEQLQIAAKRVMKIKAHHQPSSGILRYRNR